MRGAFSVLAVDHHTSVPEDGAFLKNLLYSELPNATAAVPSKRTLPSDLSDPLDLSSNSLNDYPDLRATVPSWRARLRPGRELPNESRFKASVIPSLSRDQTRIRNPDSFTI